MAQTLSPIPSTPQLKQDLRSPSFARLRRGSTRLWTRMLTLFLTDCGLLFLAWQLAAVLGTPGTLTGKMATHANLILLNLGVTIGGFFTAGFYRAGDKRRDYLGIIRNVSISAMMLLLIMFVVEPTQQISRSQFLYFWLFSALAVCSGRWIVDLGVGQLRTMGAIRYPVFLISDPEYAEQCIDVIKRENRYDIVGIVNARSIDRYEREATFAKLRQLGVVEAFVALDAIKNRQFLCWHFQTAGITLHVLPIGLEPLFKGTKFSTNSGFPALTFKPTIITGLDFIIKRSFDCCSAVVLTLLLAPFLTLIAALVFLDSPGSVFYRQTRVGLHGKPFKAWKFRTMVNNADQLQKELEARNEMKDGVLFKMKDDPRITRVGKFLRRYSLDELPQLLNVLSGEMSLVGPRPLPVRDVEKFAQHHFIRHEVLPGITGLWQVSGRSNIDNFEDVVNLDLKYIETWSLRLDLEILLRTVTVVLRKTGAY
jgi:exopolysaccharide biosynthesis polyprenyl glycosylphosphotransferase